ncbi:beta-ketoacyl synthase N-terminal-like domain-containing protein [Halalkalibacterium ligniniphilum]|uniref:beta-ketoacyl synthase N-terminal-like domain-containing protein n=1 Tax=Halalkalibacterium ligniniphilum TaxID=1134413 RepID=UPI00034BE2C9|nr:beta-ketoacyl synthase N-terminal-like domain-containing protein [Halalkalibacterium ligniniphilum]
MRVRVVVSGFGIISPGASDVEGFDTMLKNEQHALQVLANQGPNGEDLLFGLVNGEYETIAGTNYRRYPRVCRLAIAAADEAWQRAELPRTGGNNRTAVIVATSVGSLREIDQLTLRAHYEPFRTYPITTVGVANTSSVGSAIAAHFNVTGPVYTLTTSCTGSADAIFLAKLLLETGQVDRCIVGGADAPVVQSSVYGFVKIRGISMSNKLEEVGVPFSETSNGFVMSEGSAILIVEREETAMRRGAHQFGYIETSRPTHDAVSIFSSDPEGNGLIEAMRGLVADREPSYVHSQALGLAENDRIEKKLHETLFSHQVPITSIKGAIGHPFAAVGAIQAISALLSIEHSYIPATIRTDLNGFEKLPIVTATRYCKIDRVAVTNHGYGGSNNCFLLSST